MAKRTCGVTATIGLLALGLAAAGRASTPVVTSPEEYGQLCRRVNAVTGRSIQGIRTSLPELAGRCVEICGKILGLGNAHPADTKPTVVNVLVKCQDDTCFIPGPADLPELRPGQCVRMLVRLDRDARDVSDSRLEGVIEHPDLEEEAPPASGGEKRLDIGEAAMGTRDRLPGSASVRATAVGATAPPILTAAAPAYATPPASSTTAGGALPPEMRGMATLSGRNRPPAPPTAVTLPARPSLPTVATPRYTDEQVVQVWTRWVRSINGSLSNEQADLIVRWVLYHCARNGVDHRLMFAVIRFESDFDPRCVSRAGAMGLTQLMPCNVTDFKVKDPWDIAENIRGGVEHLAEFLRQYQGRSNYEQTVLALACYNAGPGAVSKYGGVPPYAETQSYVRKVPNLFADLVRQGYP